MSRGGEKLRTFLGRSSIEKPSGSIADLHKVAMATSNHHEAYLCLIAAMEKHQETLRYYQPIVDMIEKYRELNDKLFADTVTTLLRKGDPESVPSPHWPSTEVIENNAPSIDGLDEGIFSHEVSALRLCGYQVGKTEGLGAVDRETLLDNFYTRRLNPRIEQLFQSEYGSPSSMQRLLKMANVIASNCRNFKKRSNASSYSKAISDYEDDLAYLKQTYFDPLIRSERVAVDWPHTRV